MFSAIHGTRYQSSICHRKIGAPAYFPHSRYFDTLGPPLYQSEDLLHIQPYLFSNDPLSEDEPPHHPDPSPLSPPSSESSSSVATSPPIFVPIPTFSHSATPFEPYQGNIHDGQCGGVILPLLTPSVGDAPGSGLAHPSDDYKWRTRDNESRRVSFQLITPHDDVDPIIEHLPQAAAHTKAQEPLRREAKARKRPYPEDTDLADEVDMDLHPNTQTMVPRSARPTNKRRKTDSNRRTTWHDPPLPAIPVNGVVSSSIASISCTRQGENGVEHLTGRATCNYTSPANELCTAERAECSMPRHLAIHRNAEARTYLEQKALNIDISKMSLITTATINEINKSGSIISWDLELPKPFEPLPIKVRQILKASLKKAGNDITQLSSDDLALFKAVAVYLVQRFANVGYCCICNRGQVCWSRRDEFTTRPHAQPPKAAHRLIGIWRNGEPMNPLRLPTKWDHLRHRTAG